MSKKLIALLATAVMVGGQRTVIQPGEELPDLSAHDERELVASGSAEDPEDTAALQKQAARDQAAADQEFAEARAKVLDKKASTERAPDDAGDASTDPDAGNAPAPAAAPATPAKPVKAAGKK